MIDLAQDVLDDLRAHAARAYPREACGVVIVFKGRQRYIACTNLADAPGEQFVLAPADYAAAEDAGEVIAIVHSHPAMPPEPSMADRIGCERSGLPWIIVNWPTGAIHQFAPEGYVAPLVGRPFAHGVLDCYTLIRDYYREVLAVELPDFERSHEWWLHGESLYVDQFAQAGFARVDAPQLHDVLLLQVGSPTPNHGAIWLGNGLILHHQHGRLSSRDVYGGWYRKCTTHVLRHQSQRGQGAD